MIADKFWKSVKGSADAKDIEYEENASPLDQSRLADPLVKTLIFGGRISTCRPSAQGFLEKLDQLRDSLLVFEEVVGEMNEIRKIVQNEEQKAFRNTICTRWTKSRHSLWGTAAHEIAHHLLQEEQNQFTRIHETIRNAVKRTSSGAPEFANVEKP